MSGENLLGSNEDCRIPDSLCFTRGFLEDNTESMRDGAAYGMAVHGAVRNMDMINCFASFLPGAAPASHAGNHWHHCLGRGAGCHD